jgi:zinc protease
MYSSRVLPEMRNTSAPQNATPDIATDAPLSFDEYRLGNGLHVILHEDHSVPIVAVNLWYHVGSKNETEGKTGFAHLFEHMMFQGSAHVGPNEHFAYVQQAGGILNASTSYDRTNYFETLPAHQLALGLWLEADRMRSLAVTPQTLETQRSVVMEERRSRYDNQPYGTMMEQLFSHAYKAQAYRWPIIGSMEDIRNATLEEVQSFHAMYYRPSNASLCLAGDFDSDAAKELIAFYFGDLKNPGTEMYRPTLIEPAQATPVRDYVFDSIPLPGLILGFHIPDMNSPDYVALNLLSQSLTSGESSRLHRLLIYEHQVAQSVMSYAFDLEMPALFLIRVIAQNGRSLGEVEDLLWSELDAIASNGITEQELEKAKNRQETFFIQELETLQERADLLNSYHVLSGGAANINTEIARIRRVNADDIRRVAAACFQRTNATTLQYLPHQATTA